jgi:hypothetical protein
MKAENTQLNIAEKALLSIIAIVWRVLRLLDPHRAQRYFATKVNVSGHAFSRLYRLGSDDAIGHICRINNNRMKEGPGFLAKRGELVKVYNPANGRFVCRYAQGAGSLSIRFNEMGLDYDAKSELGVLDLEEVDLQVMKANPADREYYLMYQDSSMSSRYSRALGWYMLLGSLIVGLATQAYDFIASLNIGSVTVGAFIQACGWIATHIAAIF